MKLSRLGRLAVMMVLLGAEALAGPAGSGYHLIKKLSLGTRGQTEYFDYVVVDSEARRVYLTHGTEVIVVDADSLSQVGTLGPFNKCHGVVVVKGVNKGFITDGGAAKVMVFDPKTLKVTGEIKAYNDADGILYDPASKHVFSLNGDSKNLLAIDPGPATALKTLDLGGGPEQGVADGKGMIYDNIEDNNEVLAIDTNAMTIKAHYPVKPAGQPVAMAMDRETRRLFSAGRNPAILVMMDADNGKVLQSFPISNGTDSAVFDPATKLLYVSTRDGFVHIFHEDSPDKLSVADTVRTEYGAKTMALDPKTNRIFLTTADFGPPPGPGKTRQAQLGTFRLLVYGK